jgi:hypothetical protein
MPATPVRELIPVLQVAIAPVILISGVGLLLLSLTNRFGRAVDRSRQLLKEMRESRETDRPGLARQVEVLFRRARLIRLAIILATLSVLLAALLIIVLFLTALLRLEVGLLICLLFIACLTSLVAALGAFLREIHLSLLALKLELDSLKSVRAAQP